MANALLKEGAGGINHKEGMTLETGESPEQGERVQQEDIHLLQGGMIGERRTLTNKRAGGQVHHLHHQGLQEDIQRKAKAHLAVMWNRLRGLGTQKRKKLINQGLYVSSKEQWNQLTAQHTWQPLAPAGATAQN